MAKSIGSRITILANRIICNHDLHYNTRRLHWSCDCSKRRTITFRNAWNSNAGTQGNVEKGLAKPAAAAAHFWHRCTWPLETGDKKGRPGRRTGRYETLHRSGLVHRKLGHTTSKRDVDTHLGDKEVSTNAFLKNEAVKEELTDTNTKAIERIKLGSNKMCIRQNLVRKDVV